jgi:hypothetical protein
VVPRGPTISRPGFARRRSTADGTTRRDEELHAFKAHSLAQLGDEAHHNATLKSALSQASTAETNLVAWSAANC